MDVTNKQESNSQVSENPARRLDPEDVHLALQHIQSILGNSDAPQAIDALQHALRDLHPADTAFILESLPEQERLLVWREVNSSERAEVLLEVSEWVRESLIVSIDQDQLISIASDLDADEIADLASELPPEVMAGVVKRLTAEERMQLTEAMGYPEDTVGRLMDFDIVSVREDVRLDVVLRYLRRLNELPDHTDQIFVTDRHNRLLGTLYVNKLLVTQPEKLVSDIMTTEYLSLNPIDSDSDAASAFERYDLISAPVIDNRGRLIGRVTISDVVDVIQEDSETQELSRAGLQEEDIFAPVYSALRNRAPWLLINLCTASTASLVASRFEGTVSHIVILAFLMSIVAGIGGNSGNQTMTMIIRALAVGRVTGANVWQLVKREITVTFLVGVSGSVVAATFAWIISKSFAIALVMMAAMIGNMLIGAMFGVMIPMVRNHFGKDPAVGSSVLLTFATDSLGFFIFLGLATIFLI